MSIAIPGKCRHCGCTEDNACTLPTNDRCLLDQQQGVCSNPACIKAEAERVLKAGQRAREAAPKKMNRFDIWEAQARKRREQRRVSRLRKKGRAA